MRKTFIAINHDYWNYKNPQIFKNFLFRDFLIFFIQEFWNLWKTGKVNIDISYESRLFTINVLPTSKPEEFVSPRFLATQ